MADQQGQESAQQADKIRTHSFPESEFGKLAGPHSGQRSMQWGDQGQDSQGSCALARIRWSSSGNMRRQCQKRKWRRRMERRRYQRKKSIRAAIDGSGGRLQGATSDWWEVYCKVHSRTGEDTHDASSDYRYSQHPSVWIFV